MYEQQARACEQVASMTNGRGELSGQPELSITEIAFNNLRAEIGSLELVADQLYSRLDYVSRRSGQASNGQAAIPVPVKSGLVADIDDQADRIRGVGEKLYRAVQTLDI